ncbi:MAG: hypothetical protein J6X58_06060 [Bacteroidales bacterium]|nr:hypothetical protein [Bacteroidales bacterium]
MLKLFKNNTIGQILVIILAAIALWVRAFIAPITPVYEEHFSPIYEIIFGLLSPLPRLASAIALLIVLIEGAWINLMLFNHKMSKVGSLLPTLMYLVAMSWSSENLTITPTLFSNIFIIAACNQLLSEGSSSLDIEKNFNASFLVAMAGMCHMPSLTYIVPLFGVFVIYKLYNWRAFIVSILGLIAPSIILFSYAFLSDKFDYYFILLQYDITNLNVVTSYDNGLEIATNIIFILMLMAALLNLLSSLNDKTIQQRINSGVVILPLVAASVMLFYYQIFTINTQFAAIPFAFLANLFLSQDRKRPWISETLFWILIVSSIIT